MTLKKKLKHKSKFKKGDLVSGLIYGFIEHIFTITDLKVNKFKQVLYFIEPENIWINEYLCRKPTEEEIVEYIKQKLIS